MSEASARRPQSLYEVGDEPDPRFTLANERTFLAWIRTALALIAGGVALDAIPLSIADGLQKAAGVALILIGTAAAVYAWWIWFRTELAMRRDLPLPATNGMAVLTVGVVVVGVAIAVASLVA